MILTWGGHTPHRRKKILSYAGGGFKMKVISMKTDIDKVREPISRVDF